MDPSWASRLFRTYGTEVYDLLGDAKAITDLGQSFGATLTEVELRWLVQKEFARSADDVLWRRTRLGLKTSAEAVGKIEAAIISEVQKLP